MPALEGYKRRALQQLSRKQPPANQLNWKRKQKESKATTNYSYYLSLLEKQTTNISLQVLPRLTDKELKDASTTEPREPPLSPDTESRPGRPNWWVYTGLDRGMCNTVNICLHA